MKKTLHTYIAAALLLAGSLTAAAQTTAPVSVKSNELKLKGNTVYIDATIVVNSDYVESKNELTLTPVLQTADQQMGLPSVLINGKNRQKVYNREMALGNRDDEPRYAVLRAKDAPEHTIEYKTTIPYEPWMADAKFVLKEDLCGCGKEVGSELPIADRINRTPDKRYEIAPLFAYIQPAVETQKTRAEVGTAYLEFVVGKYQILPDFRNNAAELAKINTSIELVTTDKNIKTDGIYLKGFASPEGSYASNTKLADNRLF